MTALPLFEVRDHLLDRASRSLASLRVVLIDRSNTQRRATVYADTGDTRGGHHRACARP